MNPFKAKVYTIYVHGAFGVEFKVTWALRASAFEDLQSWGFEAYF